jgi:uncharacterized protein (DUF4415 family)
MQNMIKTRSGRQLIMPSDSEELQIAQGISVDPETFEPSDEQLNQLRPSKLGRPVAEQTKEKITIRLSPDTVAAFRRTGSGWQTRIDSALREWLQEHTVS